MNSSHTPLCILQLGTMDTKGGAAMVSWILKKELETRGHLINMIVGYKRSHDHRVREIWDTPINNFLSAVIKRNFRFRLHYHLAYWTGNDIAFLPGKRIINLLEFKNADIVHCHNLHTLYFNLKTLPALSLLKPTVWTLHDTWAITGDDAYMHECKHWMTGGCRCSTPRTLPKLFWNNSQHLWNLKKKIYSHSHLHLVTPSQWLADRVSTSILKSHPCTVIYNGIDEQIFAPGDRKLLRTQLNLPQDKVIVLFVGKGGKDNVRKGWTSVLHLIASSRDRHDILFLCLGGFDPAIKNQPHVSFIPYVSDPAILARYYAASDILLYPSLADNCPLVVLEAMACGLPVLTYSTGGIPELVIHKKNGYVARYKNLQDLQQGFEWMTKLPPAIRTAISIQCRTRVLEKFTKRLMVENYLNLYYQILSHNSKRER